MQQAFSKTSIFKGLLVAVLVLATHGWLAHLPDRLPRRGVSAVVEFRPVRLDSSGFAPLRLAGAWTVTSVEPRMGGVSALAFDRGGLLALSDSGVVIRLPKPGTGAVATFSDLPSGPGRANYKAGRDSEALARDGGGHGWWVAFENRHSAWLFDREFARVIRKIDLRGLGWPSNKGAEGAVSTPDALILLPESGDEMVRITARGIERRPIANAYRLSDAVPLPDGRTLLLARTFGPAGFAARLLLLDKGVITPLARLGLGRLDNAEAIAAEARPGGGFRLWLMTDNDFRRRVPTMLVALDWAG